MKDFVATITSAVEQERQACAATLEAYQADLLANEDFPGQDASFIAVLDSAIHMIRSRSAEPPDTEGGEEN